MNAIGRLHEFAFAPDVRLGRAGRYVAFLSVANVGRQQDSQFTMPISIELDRMAGGFVYTNNGANPSEWYSDWNSPNDADDVWFKAQLVSDGFARTPEPASLTLLGVGAILIAQHMRRKTQALGE
jgi:hypothetical protein